MPTPKKGRQWRFPPKKIVITPADKVVINRMYLEGRSTTEIAASFDVPVQRIGNIVREELRPVWQESMKADAERELAKIDNLEREAWQRINEAAHIDTAAITDPEELRVAIGMIREIMATAPQWMNQIRWCITLRAKLHRNYEQQFREADAELRVAGAVNREQVEQQMAIRLVQIGIASMKEEEERLAEERAAKKPSKKPKAHGRGRRQSTEAEEPTPGSG